MARAKTPKPILMTPEEIIYLKEATEYAKRSAATIRRWCKRYGIARRSGDTATYEISLLALEMVIYGDFEALELLRTGHRDHPDVTRYTEHLGLMAQPRRSVFPLASEDTYALPHSSAIEGRQRLVTLITGGKTLDFVQMPSASRSAIQTQTPRD